MKANSYTYAKDLSKVTAISAVHFPLRHKENGCIASDIQYQLIGSISHKWSSDLMEFIDCCYSYSIMLLLWLERSEFLGENATILNNS